VVRQTWMSGMVQIQKAPRANRGALFRHFHRTEYR
jgi:hypothetical protein